MKKIFELLFKQFVQKNARKPNNLENILLKQKAMQQSIDEKKVIQFPPEAITDWTKPRHTIGKKADVVPSGISRKTEKLDVEDMSRAEKDEIFNNWLVGADQTYYKFVNETLAKIQKMDKVGQLAEAKNIINRKGMYRHLEEKDAAKLLKSIDQNIKPVEPKAEGGVAGLLGERTGFANGRWADPGMSPGTRADYSPGQGHRDTPSKRLRKNLTNRIFHETRQPGFETATSKKKQEKQQQDIRDLQKQMADVSWDDHARDYVTQHTLNEFQKQTAPRLPKIPKPTSEPPSRGRRRPPPWFLPEFQKRRYLYQKEEDLPEGILELLKNTAENQTILKISCLNKKQCNKV
jgi:hypothetical protein